MVMTKLRRKLTNEKTINGHVGNSAHAKFGG